MPTSEGDLKDGAGAVSAQRADEIAQTRHWSATDPCESSCWMGVHVDSGAFADNGKIFRYVHATEGKRVRIAISWWPKADACPTNVNCSDVLDSDFDLCVFTPSGNYVQPGLVPGEEDEFDAGAASGSCSVRREANYELVDFTANVTGDYKIQIKRYDEQPGVPDGFDDNDIGVAVWVQQ